MPKVEVIRVTAGLPKELEQAARGILKLHDQVASRIAQGETKLVELQIRLDKAKTQEQKISLDLRMRKVEEGVARERRALQQLVLEYNKARAAALRLGLAFDKLGREAPRALTAAGPGGAIVLSGTRAIGPLGGTAATRQGVRVQGGQLGPFTGPVATPGFARPGAGFPFFGFFGQQPPAGGGGFGGFPPGGQGGQGGPGGPLFPGGLVTGGTTRFLTQLLGVQLVASAIRKIFSDVVGSIKEAVTEGVKMNALFETMRIGVAATLAQNAKITDQFGNQLTGLDAVNAALAESEKIQQKIVAAAFESGSGLDKFLEAFRIALPLALQMGSGLEDTVDVTKRLVLAANAIGIPFDLVRLQIDDILRGVVTTRTTLARVLGITQDILRPAREQGKVIELVRAKTEAFLAAQEQIGNTYTVQIERAKLLGQVVLRDLARGAFLRFQEVLRSILKDLATVDKVTGEIKLNPELQEAVDKLNVAFRDFASLLVETAPLIVSALGGVLSIVGRLVAGFGLLSASTKRIFSQFGPNTPLNLESQARSLESRVTSGKSKDPQADLAKALEFRARARRAAEQDEADEKLVEAAERFALSVDDAIKATDKFAERLGQTSRERSAGRGPTPPGGKITPVKTDTEIQAALAKEEADLEGRVLAVKQKELEVDKKLADLGFTALNLTSEQEERERGALRLKKAELAIEEALLRVQSAQRQVEHSGGGTVEQRERKQLNRARQELQKAQAAREIEQKRTDEAIALGRLEDYRISQIQQRVRISQRELSVQTEMHDLDLRASRLGEEEVAKRRAALRVAEAELRVQEAVLNLKEKLAAAEAARFSESSQRRVAAQNDLRAARGALDKSVEDRERARSAGSVGISDAALRESDARRRLAATERSERLRREELSASGQLVEAERELLRVRERTSDFDVVALTAAENRLETERATLAVVVARARAAEALARLNDAGSRANELIRGGFSEQSNEMRAVRLEEERALSDLHAAELGVQEATADVERARIDNQRRMIDAMRQQVGLAESLLSSFARLLGVMNSSLGTTLQIMAAIREAVRGIKAAVAATKAQRKAREGQAPGGGDDHEGDGSSGLADAVASNENVADKTNKVAKAFDNLFQSIGDFVKNGGIEALVSLGIAIHDAFGQGLGQGIGAALQAVGSFVPGPVGVALQAGGAIVSMIGGMFTKGARKLAAQISKAINSTLNSFNAGTLNLGPAIAQLEKQRADAINRLSGKKGGQKELDKILPEIDSAIAQLKRQQKEIFEAFDKELKILRLPDQFRDIGKSVEELNEKIRAFLDAGGNYLQAQEYLARSLQDIFRNASRTLREDELEVIDLLQREIDLHKAREEAINDAAKAERDVRSRLGITRQLTPAQEAAIQIREIRRRRDERVEEIDRELQLVDAQLEGRRELYELGLTEEELFARRLDLTRQETAEIRERIRLIQEFLQQNAAAFAAAFSSFPPGAGVPNVPFFTGSHFTPGGITVGQVLINPHPGMSPREAWEIVREGMEYGARRPWAVLT